MSIRFLCLRFQKMHMASTANVDSTAGLTLELMVMSIGKIRAEADLVYMVVAAHWNRLTAYSCKAMVVRVVTAAYDLRAANDLMHMLFLTIVIVSVAATSGSGIAAATVIFFPVVIAIAVISSPVVIATTIISSSAVAVIATTAAITVSAIERERDVVLTVDSAL